MSRRGAGGDRPRLPRGGARPRGRPRGQRRARWCSRRSSWCPTRSRWRRRLDRAVTDACAALDQGERADRGVGGRSTPGCCGRARSRRGCSTPLAAEPYDVLVLEDRPRRSAQRGPRADRDRAGAGRADRGARAPRPRLTPPGQPRRQAARGVGDVGVPHDPLLDALGLGAVDLGADLLRARSGPAREKSWSQGTTRAPLPFDELVEALQGLLDDLPCGWLSGSATP